ncbi:hypothetical protein FRC03_007914 [Tulasnella sp. 419]|nr:hypothetical protein FRC03_007914 [Tulasnella sp. 419]
MASQEQVVLNEPHPPAANALEAFNAVLRQIKNAIVASRQKWDKHEPRMWARATGLTDEELVGSINLEKDLVEVRSGATAYGTIVFGKIRVGTSDDQEGFVHVRIHDPQKGGTEDIKFHSIFSDEGTRNADGQASTYNAIQYRDTPLEFFNE